MKVKELKMHLETVPDDMIVAIGHRHDARIWNIVSAATDWASDKHCFRDDTMEAPAGFEERKLILERE